MRLEVGMHMAVEDHTLHDSHLIRGAASYYIIIIFIENNVSQHKFLTSILPQILPNYLSKLFPSNI